jgi:hypothetical protein
MPYAAINGLNMYYEVHGEAPPLLLLHGGLGRTAGVTGGSIVPLSASGLVCGRIISPKMLEWLGYRGNVG